MKTQNIPTFCWHCGGLLKPSYKEDGPPVLFDTVVDQVGNKHAVHKVCKKDAAAECRKITAQERDAKQ